MDEYPQYLSPSALRPHPSLRLRSPAAESANWDKTVDEVRETGVEEAILFVEENGKWLIVEGLLRWKAAIAADLTAIPCKRVTPDQVTNIIGMNGGGI